MFRFAYIETGRRARGVPAAACGSAAGAFAALRNALRASGPSAQPSAQAACVRVDCRLARRPLVCFVCFLPGTLFMSPSLLQP